MRYLGGGDDFNFVLYYESQHQAVEHIYPEFFFDGFDKPDGTVGAAAAHSGGSFIGHDHDELSKKQVGIPFHGCSVAVPSGQELLQHLFYLKYFAEHKTPAALVDPYPGMGVKVIREVLQDVEFHQAKLTRRH